MILEGYFEGLSSERGIAWQCAESLSLREFLGTGGMRLTHLRALKNVQKRYLLHAVACNLGVLMRHIHN